jgi:deoxyribodipyrimidine photolyase
MRTVLVLFTRDLRVPRSASALSRAAREYEQVVPLFVVDDRVMGSRPAPNRTSFLLDALADLRESLRERGGNLVIRTAIPSRRPFEWLERSERPRSSSGRTRAATPRPGRGGSRTHANASASSY